jgi:hypothetical protein
MRKQNDFMKSEHKNFLNRRTHGLVAVLAIAVCCCAPELRAQSTNSDATASYDSFSLIWQRNIFDPNRRRYNRPPTSPGHKVDAFALVGTMSYSKGKFAFFDGTSPDYKKVLEPGATIAGYTVKDITPKTVMLALNGKDLELSVGSQMRNEGQNNWKLSTQRDLPSTSNQSTDAPAALSVPAGANAAMSEILKRLAEQKQQEEQGLK